MTKYLFLIPLYNDWRSLNFLLKKINFEIANKKRVAEVIILNDASKAKNLISKKNLRYLKKISVVNLKENLGSQKAISIGLGYINSLRKKSIIIVMDCDGEDDPSKINIMIDKAKKFPNHVIVSNRTKRKEKFLIKYYFYYSNYLFNILVNRSIS